ncbi:surface lipoprotein assembly modifier [Catenovulum agarivorans]|uniref:surface lipoprotein assembly modifier n=1 Tax=Catenovulum agarivorans TaxID=1172192 RepID=UPI0002E82F52|nr:surface lipoprotein assembly modifier [Catenovulum agarivorans]
MFSTAKNLKKIVYLGLLLCAHTANAQTDDRKYLIKLVEAGLYQDAFELAESLFDQYAGDSDFDYLYGLAARQIGMHQEAIFAFERVVINRPNNLNARYALAVAYFEVNNLVASKREFVNLLKLKPTAKVTEQAERYLLLIDKKSEQLDPVWSGYAGLALGYDSNANSGLGDELYPIPVAGVGIFDLQFPVESDSFSKFDANVAYRYPTAKFNAWFASANVSHTQNSKLTDFNKSNLDLAAGYNYKLGAMQLRANAFAQAFWYGGEKYHDMLAVMGSANLSISESTSVQLSGNYSMINNAVNDNLDINSATLRLQYIKQLNNARLAIGTSFRDENVKSFTEQSQQYERTINGISASWMQKFESWGMLRLSWQYQQAEHQHLNLSFKNLDGVSPFFAEKRKDHNIIYQLGYEYPFANNWTWRTQARISRKNSNQYVYSFDRNVVNSGIRYTF